MIERNVIEEVCRGIQKATAAIVLTHNIDFLFVESILLPRLRDLGSPQLTIFADAACAASSFRMQERLVTKLGTRYRVVPIDLGSARRFHPKAIFLYGDQGASLVVGSGNATHGGWSSNQEIWSDFVYPGEGGAQIAAFIPYLQRILEFVPEATHIRSETIGDLASPGNAWYSTLPPALGLAWTPSQTPLLDQILGATGREISSIDILSPYFDPSATALQELAALSSGTVRVFLQPRKAGLSSDLAAILPAKVKLQKIEADVQDRRYKFIHAKSYVIETSDGHFLVTGSANCSSSALLSSNAWGNAELVAVRPVSKQEITEFWSGYAFSDEPPPLPEVHPAEEWTVDTTDIRILGARKFGERLEVFFKTQHALTGLQLHVAQPDSQVVAAMELTKDRATFLVAGSISSVWLSATLPGGAVITSSPSWVDDERSLSVSGAERSIKERLEGAASRGSLLGNELLAILELFDQHIQKPAGHSAAHRPKGEGHSEPIYFSEDDIYTSRFPGAPPLFSPALAAGGFSEAEALALIYSFFQTDTEDGGTSPLANGQSHEDAEGEDEKPEDVARVHEAQTTPLAGHKLVRLLKKIEGSLAYPAYASSRAPTRLSSDIASIAILMSFARLKGQIAPADYRERTMAMWKVLFFGETGDDGAVPRYLAGLSASERAVAISELRSAKLSAAMATWCMIDWTNADSEARKFRFASAELASRHRWLSEGSDRESVMREIDRIAMKLLPSDREQLLRLWNEWLRDGHSVFEFRRAVEDIAQRELAQACVRTQLRKGEVVWQSRKGFCIITEDFYRSSARRATLQPVDRPEPFKVQSDFVAPITDLLRSDLPISDNVKRQIFDLVNAIEDF